MINLTATSDILRVITSSANAIHVQSNWIDHTSTAYTPGRTNTVIAAAATTTITPAPAASTQRSVKHIVIDCVGTTNAVTVQYFDGATAFQLFSVALVQGDQLSYTDTDGWKIMDGSGNQKVTTGSVLATGGFLRRTLVTATASPFALLSGTRTVRVRMQGGGGQGGGAPVNAANNAGAGTGGNAGGIVDFTGAQTVSFVFAIGAAGSGAAAGAAGTAGGATTATVAGVALSATGGPGGTVQATGAVTLATDSPAAVTGSGAGAQLIEGKRGESARVLQNAVATTTIIAVGGKGGDGEYGNGGAENLKGSATSVAGKAASGLASGGGGALSPTGGASVAGGAATGGWMLVEEFS